MIITCLCRTDELSGFKEKDLRNLLQAARNVWLTANNVKKDVTARMRHLCSWSCKISSGRTTVPQTCYGRSCPSLASVPSPVLQATPSRVSGLLPPKHVKWHRKGLIWVPQELPREGHLLFRMCSGSWRLGVQALLPTTCPEGGAASRGGRPSRGDGAGSALCCVQHPVLTPGC